MFGNTARVLYARGVTTTNSSTGQITNVQERRRGTVCHTRSLLLTASLLVFSIILSDVHVYYSPRHGEPVILTEVIDTCEHIVGKCMIQVPRKKKRYDKWKDIHWGFCSHYKNFLRSTYISLDCDNVMGWYNVTTLDNNSVLPTELLQHVSNEDQTRELMESYRVIIEVLSTHHVSWFVAFGTLIASVRNGVLLNPWDDDADIMVERQQFENALKGIPCSFRMTDTHCKMWNLTREITLSWKNTGMPYKVHRRQKTYPFVDINTFSVQDDFAVVPSKELKSGHIKSFNVSTELLYGILTGNDEIGNRSHQQRLIPVAESMRSDNLVNVSVPHHFTRILQQLYGDDVLERCQSSYIHKRFCKESACENPMANHMPSITFPCCLLPKTLRRGVLEIDNCLNE